jgi:hypothetical protein
MIRDEADQKSSLHRRRYFTHEAAAVQKGSPPLSLLPPRRFAEYGSIKASSRGERRLCRGK